MALPACTLTKHDRENISPQEDQEAVETPVKTEALPAGARLNHTANSGTRPQHRTPTPAGGRKLTSSRVAGVNRSGTCEDGGALWVAMSVAIPPLGLLLFTAEGGWSLKHFLPVGLNVLHHVPQHGSPSPIQLTELLLPRFS